jgi:RNA polymerase sigma-70 factor (ECF subfamily)
LQKHLYGVSTIAEREQIPGVVASAVAGDEVAFARIVAAHHDDMVRVAYLVTCDVDLAREAVQSAWPIAWRKLASLRDPARLRPWLISIAANEARQILRQRRRRQVTEIRIDGWAAGVEPAGSRLDQRSRELDLVDALRRLPADDRAIVAMRYALGLHSSEIAQATGLSAPGVRSRLARALERLRKELGDD